MIQTTAWRRTGGIWQRDTDSPALLTAQPASSFLKDFDYRLAPLAGCPYACLDCYVPDLPTIKFRRDVLPNGQRLKDAATWGQWIEVRVQALRILRHALERGDLTGKTIFMSPVVDVYWPGEKKRRLTRQLLECFVAQPVFDWLLISTRSDLVLRDIDLFQQLGAKVEIGITIPTGSSDVAAVLGRRNPSLARRFTAVTELVKAGVPAPVHAAPLQPHSSIFAAQLAETGAWVWLWTFTPTLLPALCRCSPHAAGSPRHAQRSSRSPRNCGAAWGAVACASASPISRTAGPMCRQCQRVNDGSLSSDRQLRTRLTVPHIAATEPQVRPVAKATAMISSHAPLPTDLPDSPAGWEVLLKQLLGRRLTERQRQVAARWCLGYTDTEIAADLGVTAATVRAHDTHILEKLHLNSVHQIPVCCFSLLWQRYLAAQRDVDRKIDHAQQIDDATSKR